MCDINCETYSISFSRKSKGFCKGCPICMRSSKHQLPFISRPDKELFPCPLRCIRECRVSERDLSSTQVQDERQLSIGPCVDHFQKWAVRAESNRILFESEAFYTSTYGCKNSNIRVCFNCYFLLHRGRGRSWGVLTRSVFSLFNNSLAALQRDLSLLT